MSNVNFALENGFEIMEKGAPLTAKEAAEMERFLTWYGVLKDAVSRPISELTHLQKAKDLVRVLLEDETALAAIIKRRAKIQKILKSMPLFPYSWPNELNPFEASATIARIKQSV